MGKSRKKWPINDKPFHCCFPKKPPDISSQEVHWAEIGGQGPQGNELAFSELVGFGARNADERMRRLEGHVPNAELGQIVEAEER